MGRDRELALCRAALTQASTGRATFLEIIGEPGIGKTALLATVAEDLRFRCLRVTGFPTAAKITFGGLESLLRPLTGWIGDVAPDRRQSLLTVLSPDGSPMPDILSLAGSVADLLAIASEHRPLLVLVDDAHWLDDPSREVLDAVCHRLAGEHVVVLTARRPGGFEGSDHTLRLDPLGAGDASLLVRDRRPEVDNAVADEVGRRAAGNPLALLELAGQLTQQQAQGQSPLAQDDLVPLRIREAFLSQIARLSADARALLVVLACLDNATVTMVLSVAEHVALATEAEQVIDELLDSGLVLLDATTLRLRHPLLGSTVTTSVGVRELRRVHLGIAAALADVDPVRALWHRAAAPGGADDALADDLIRLAERLAAGAQPDSARRALEAAAERTLDSARRTDVLIRAAEVALTGPSGATVADLLGRLPARSFLEADQLRRIRIVEAHLALRSGAGGDAATALLDVAQELPAGDRAAVVIPAVVAAIGDRDHVTARSGADLLEASSGSSDSAELRAFVGLVRAIADYLAISPRPTLTLELREAIAGWRDVGHLPSLVVMRDAAMEAGELQTARAIALAVADATRPSGDESALADAVLAVAFCDHALVNWNSAAARAFEVTQIARASSVSMALVEALLLLADIDASRGHQQACRSTCARIRALAERLDDPAIVVLADRREALLDIPGADPTAALRRLAAAERTFRTAGLAHPFYSPVPDLVEVLVRLGRRDEAVTAAPRFLDLVGPGAPAPPRARALRIRGLLAEDGGYRELFDESIRLDLLTGQTFHAARTQLCHGERLRRDGQRVAAREQLEQALNVFAGVDADPWIRRTESELAAAGAPGAAGRPCPPGIVHTLTHRELQIASLVAEGHRNVDIAAALFLSTKTVEFHLTHAYRKTGVSNRTQLAAVMSTSAAAT